jgi:serine/threonine protein phosphatase PrpC
MNSPETLFEAAKATALGDRQCNQDRSLFLSGHGTTLLGLADGLGGHPRGEVAAQLLVDVCESMFRQTPKPLFDPENFMLQCIGKAHTAILRFGRRQDPPIAPRTTAVLAVVQGGIAYWAHVGDSRLYLIRDGDVRAQTRDHSQIRFVRQSESEASRPRASLTRCLGGLAVPPTTTCGPPTLLQTGDVLVLCSDGLWGQLPRQALVEGLGEPGSPFESRLKDLVERAAGAPNSDNVTAVAMHWLASADQAGERAGLVEMPDDPQLDQAIEHLHSVLKKTSEPHKQGK